MKPRKTYLDASAVFDRAVREHALAVLSVQEDGQWHSFKSRFLERDPNQRFFVLDYQADGEHPLPALSPGQYIGVSFRQRSHKVLFATLVEAKGHFVVDNQTSVPAIRYRWPQTMVEMQRRAYYRTPVPESQRIIARLWAGGVAARAAGDFDPATTISATLANLSCGGAMLHLSGSLPQTWAENEALGIELPLGDGRAPLMLDAHFRGARMDEQGQTGLAVQFVGLEVSIDGRNVLQRIASTVQRFHRQGMLAR